jgi:DNA-binding NarL/FixJ family response regulator
MRILVLEDDPIRINRFKQTLSGHDVSYAETARGAISFLAGKTFDIVFLDHDLGGQTYVETSEKNTGSEVVRWIMGVFDGEKDHREKLIYPKSRQDWRGTRFIVHSMNTAAALSMTHDLGQARCAVNHVPFNILRDKLDDFKNTA